MATLDLSSKTVIELRKLAKENGVVLGAGVNKESIIAKLTQALSAQEEPEAEAVSPAPEAESAPAEAAPAEPVSPPSAETATAQPKAESAQPQYRAAWHNPAPRYSSKPAYQAPGYGQRQGNWQQNRQPTMDAPRASQTKPTGFTPRFGPAASAPVEEAAPQPRQQEDEYRPAYRQDAPRTVFGPGAQERRSTYGDAPRTYDAQRSEPAQRPLSDPGFDSGYQQPQPRTTYEQRPAYEQRPRYEQRSTYQAPRRDNYYPQQTIPQQPDPALPTMAANELLSAGECLDGAGVLELHPDGYGFLRSEHFLPSSKDIYVSMAQIRRFGLRTGDYISGKTRPQREGDKYAAMLYITEINGQTAEDLVVRPSFDELTPVYPTRRIDLEAYDGPQRNTMRLVDLIAPLGFGQRALILCPPETGKTELMQDFANVIKANHPDAEVMVLLIDETPEDVTCFREQVCCPVLASTFDQPPENHLRLTELVLERAQRLVEQGRDVVLMVDSLTRLVKTYTTTAAQQGRGMPGMVNPTSLFRAKKLFGAARCLKEGGSLTVIGAMNVESGNKVDDTIVEEFKGTANMELWLDAAVARAGVSPALNLQLCTTKRAEMLLTAPQLEGLKLIRSIMTSTRSVTAIPQLLSMMDKAATNDELLVKIKGWVELMGSSR